MAAERLAAFLFEPLASAELEAGLALGLSAFQAETFQVSHAMLDVCTKLLLQIILGLRTMKKPRG